MVVGDTNRLVGDIIPGNDPKVSFGGQMIRSLIDSDKYVLINGSSKVTGGPGTRENPAIPEQKSALDLVIVSTELEKYIKGMEIDDSRKFSPFRRTPSGKVSYSDHYEICVTFRNIPCHVPQNKSQKKYQDGIPTNLKVGLFTKL